ncbi:MAG: trypsin-like peptidase domain-containing protein [Anaerolineae bacterium]|nr:trypsin-like peptidase domain-containing protein [Anaerolineae bacterium]
MSDNFLQQLNDDLAAVVQKVRRSLVQVSNGRSGHGAGSIWHADGLIVTNNHVVGRRPPTVTLADGRSFTATLLARDEEHDLAALAIDATNLPTIELGDSKSLKPGQWVTSVGHPWGILGAITSGMVIGQTGNEWPELRQISDEHEWVVASLHMRPGHSGGPMVDDQGRLVGINTMINGPDVGVAIPYYPGSVAHAFYRRALDLMHQHGSSAASTARQTTSSYV